MNIKFKMPKIGRNLSGKGMLKEIVLTVIGTTISIVLTFGTAHLLEQRQKRISGRQTAMMVIHDIDDNVDMFRKLAKEEKRMLELTQYVNNHLDSIDTLPYDTLNLVFSYLSENVGIQIDDSKEKIFHSSQESWKDIDNSQFIDLIQQFYYERHTYLKYFNDEFIFNKPISRDQVHQIMLDTPNFDLGSQFGEILSRLLKDQNTLLHLTYSPSRQSQYEEIASRWQRLSNQCKFIMGITDEELAEYVENRERSGNKMKDSELVGDWTEVASSEDYSEKMQFLENHRFIHLAISALNSALYSGQAYVMRTMHGTWELKGDSIIRTYETGDQYYFDKSHISYPEELKDTVENYLSSIEKTIEQQRKMSETQSYGRTAYTAFMDDSGDKMEMGITYTDENGKEARYTVYLVRDK